MKNTTKNTMEIKTDFIPYIREKSELARRERLAKEYSQTIERSKAKRKTEKKSDIIYGVVGFVCILALAIMLFSKAFSNEQGYYKRTETMQSDGTYYIYVTERICEVTEIRNDLVTVECKGNLYDFYVCENDIYEVGDKVICQFTNNWEIVGVEEYK